MAFVQTTQWLQRFRAHERHITDRGSECLRVFLERYEADFLTPCDVLGAVQGHEAGERMEGCQALVPCRNSAAPTLLQMKEEAEATYVVERQRGTKV